ncbi:MAG: hypothetical protein IKE55_01120 [Kiritimatiellae bacterium]|nr:hypothetical protein [Kiritimatiellia bacterium]
MKRAARGLFFALAASAALLAAADDPYQYIIAGYPVENPCRSAASGGMPMATGRFTRRSAESPLEARYRTVLESDGIRLVSTEFRGCIFVVW